MRIFCNELASSDKLSLITRITGKDLWAECDFNTYDPDDPDEWDAGWVRIYKYDTANQICYINFIYAHEFEDLAITFKPGFWDSWTCKVPVSGIRFYSKKPDLLTTEEVKELLYSEDLYQ